MHTSKYKCLKYAIINIYKNNDTKCVLIYVLLV